MIILAWIFLSLIVGAIGTDGKGGFLQAMVLSLILSPLIGLLITLFMESKAAIADRARSLQYQQQQIAAMQNLKQQNNPASELEKIIALRNTGHLSEEEFIKMKSKIVN